MELSQGKSHSQHHSKCYFSRLNGKEMIISVNFLQNLFSGGVFGCLPSGLGDF